MAVVFEIVIRQAPDVPAVQAPFVGATVLVRDQPVALQRNVARFPTYTEVSVWLWGLGHDPKPDIPGAARRSLVPADVTAVGDQLYAMLRQVDQPYEAACVGFDPEERVDLDLVRAELDELPDPPPGMVVTPAIRDDLGWTAWMEPFGPEHWWRPYEGPPSLFEDR